MSFSQALGGLNAAATNLDSISNNIANSATYGFKSSTASFADIFAGSKVGIGVKVADIIQDFTDGTTTNTGRALDVAINQNGFFRLVDGGGGIFYSRNGQFKLDEERNLVNMQGLRLTGYMASGEPPTIQQEVSPVPLSIPGTPMQAKSTTSAAMQINLNSTDEIPPVAFDATNANSYNKKGTVTVFDDQGNAHDINIWFRKVADNGWSVYTQDATVGLPATELSGHMVFANNGAFLGILPPVPDAALITTLTTAAATAAALPENITITSGVIGGATAATFTIGFTDSMQQNFGSSNIVASSQDGYKPGNLLGFQINEDGTLVGNYSNEQSRVLGQIALAGFANSEGLAPQGDNVWAATRSSGEALLGIAGTGNFGTLTNGALESSNVDLNKELVNMIVAQRNYQANAQTIKAQDQILNTLLNMR